ncbi:DUF2141 domain-containing protein [Aureimonas leprariae]|uniref:DUF2141 domain-containing protein n=1 Tax=Plantimonas leprariae TaxID=2615207 RepID=A0A7V7PKV5_9HYPH|nr:DUF2141 domain-containing protein [Aureimonas leprariae]KAB0676407.1 DUF2141 domain-containing protein [Aureimonas leprariae]
MASKLIPVVATALLASAVAAPNAVEKAEAAPVLGRLVVSVSGLQPRTGSVMVALFDGRKRFPSVGGQVAGRRVAVTGASTAEAVFDGIPQGRYAVAVFYDRNNNGKLDTRLGAIPVEPLGFSNGAKVGLFGPPAYEDAAFDLASTERTIRIAVR